MTILRKIIAGELCMTTLHLVIFKFVPKSKNPKEHYWCKLNIFSLKSQPFLMFPQDFYWQFEVSKVLFLCRHDGIISLTA
jgi:hypothetical protein